MTAPSTRREHPKVKGAPDYDDPTYWDVKFATGKDVGEWLNSGEILIETTLSELDHRPQSSAIPRALHLGPGISKLGVKLSEAFRQRNWPGSCIVNVDFSAEAVRIGRELESGKDSDLAMHWLQIDLRSWSDVAQLTNYAPFDVVVDKSTSDAIATSPSVTLTPESDTSSICPILSDILKGNVELTLSPVELLALHLVPLTQKGSTWVVLSYSNIRFDNLGYAGKYWTVVSRTSLKAPQGQTSTFAHTPEVFHWAYVLRRNKS
ncbi:hypothetical protein KXV68_002128 [Aspergillus fumigatus]|nr:hypothetical protein CNMCM8714_001031 [Aspergillus fumigatus]KAH1300603.1 hypothetical protein KXX11_005070 [Aspergillus fumigatus]KAH1344033.1 hypothetical protein KXX67_004265 [Aspergillus fumigatus]KAH1457208.1 hypothetical protein KXX13_009327 [Aspergillus fumigatus]KAH1530330.1 hypothetical protein KXX18_007960 [Aspergillus fumigatus]